MLPIVGLPTKLDIRQSPSLGRGWNHTNDSYQAGTAKRSLRKYQDVIRRAGTVLDRDRLYVAARGYAKFALFNQFVAAGSGYDIRLRDNRVCETP
jgi:hypothetical protein